MTHSGNSFKQSRHISFGSLHTFHGGLQLPGHREITANTPIGNAGIPPLLTIPLQQHIGDPAECLVKPGDSVYKGQALTNAPDPFSVPVHASSSGTVIAVEERLVPHPSGVKENCVVIETDGQDSGPDGQQDALDYLQIEPARLCELVQQAGIVGMGGAGFPTRIKLCNRKQHIELLLINAAECEPYISCDNRMLQERAAEVVEGVRIMRHGVQPDACIIAIEDDMHAAEQALRTALEAANESDITITRIPELYPSGGERQLIKILTGREVPSEGFPADIGIVCQNVGTAAAVYNAIAKRQPLISRIVTVTGEGIAQPQNLECLLGTPVSYLVTQAGGYTKDVERLLIGGPMMGYAVQSDNIPVIKTTNCVLAVSREEMPAPPPALPCIRCGKCTDVCPADLLPQQLYWYARSNNYDAAQDYNLFDCIECGCCAYVCPSHIPLVQYYRHAKTEIWVQETQKQAADIARTRHESRLARLDRIKQERAERMAKKKRALAGDDGSKDAKQSAIQAALDRVKHKKQQALSTPKNIDNLTATQQKKIDEADERRRQKQSGNNT